MTKPTSIPSTLRGHYAGFVSRAIALVLDLMLVITFQFIFVLVVSLLLNFFGLDELASAIFEPNSGEASSPLVTVLRLVLSFITGSIFLAVYLIFFWTLIDQSLGQILMGLRVVRTNGNSLTLVPSIKRMLGYYLSFFALGLGFLWVLIDDRRQGWHDKIADTVVVYNWDARIGRRMREWLAGRETKVIEQPKADALGSADNTYPAAERSGG